jgi:hypothetical protein
MPGERMNEILRNAAKFVGVKMPIARSQYEEPDAFGFVYDDEEKKVELKGKFSIDQLETIIDFMRERDCGPK